MGNKRITLRATEDGNCPVAIVWTRHEVSDSTYERKWTMYDGTRFIISDKSLHEILHKFIDASIECTKYEVDTLDDGIIPFSEFEYALQAFLNRTVGR